jgi:serine/threonine-protein phosphatase 4 regulatory subunit 1
MLFSPSLRGGVEHDCFSLQLMSKMAPLLGRDVTERVFLRRFSQLCSSNMFYTRKVCASHIGDFCAIVGKDQFEKVLVSTSDFCV